MMKNKTFQIVISLIMTAVLFLSVAEVASADGQNCVSQYGGAVVCGNTPPVVHAPVQAGIGDINFGVVGTVVLAASTAAYFYSKRLASRSSQI